MAVVAFFLLLGWSRAGMRQRSVKITWSPLYLPAGCFFLIGTIQFAARLTMDPIGTREALLKLSTDLILFFLAVQLFGVRPNGVGPQVGAEGDRVLRWTILAYTFVLALFAIFQFFSSDGLIYWHVRTSGWTFGPYVNHNHYAGLMEMLIPLSIASALPALGNVVAPGFSPARTSLRGSSRSESGSRPPAAMLALVILIPITSLLLSGSRGGLIAFLAEVLLAGVLVLGFGPAHARRVTALVGGGALLAAALLFFWMAPRHVVERLARMGGGTHPREVELGNRLEAARDSLGILLDHRWLGAGIGGFEATFPRYMSFPTDLRWDHAHNDYAEALAETGLVGATVILSALGLFFWLAFRGLRERLRHPAGWMQFAAAIGCCGLLVHSLVDFNLHMPANAAWFVVCVAVATRAT
jgi:O-antigen ligase